MIRTSKLNSVKTRVKQRLGLISGRVLFRGASYAVQVPSWTPFRPTYTRLDAPLRDVMGLSNLFERMACLYTNLCIKDRHKESATPAKFTAAHKRFSFALHKPPPPVPPLPDDSIKPYYPLGTSRGALCSPDARGQSRDMLPYPSLLRR